MVLSGVLIVVLIVVTIILPIGAIVYVLHDYGFINEDESLFYSPDTVKPIENLSIYSEIGDVRINYVDPSVDYLVKIDIICVMKGKNLANKKFGEFFTYSWNNESYFANFTFSWELGVIPVDVIPLLRDLTISISLRSNVIFDVSTHLIDGNLNLNIPFGVQANNFDNIVIRGNISYDLLKCDILGNVSAKIKQGNLEYIGRDIQYTQNSSLFFSVEQGDFQFDLIQNEEIGVNVTCIAEIHNGGLIFNYEDSSDLVGAVFEIPFNTSTGYDFAPCLDPFSYLNCVLQGFDDNVDELNLDLLHEYNDSFIFTSLDLKNKQVTWFYNVIFYLIQGSFDMELKSLE